MRNYHKSLLAIAATFSLVSATPVFADDFATALNISGPRTTDHTVTGVIKRVSNPWTIGDYVNNQRTASIDNYSVSMLLNAGTGTWQNALGMPPKL